MSLDLGGGYRLRLATASDHAAMNMVCLKTGDSGQDASAREDDPDLLGTIYAVPYQVFDPDFCFVFDGPDGVAGYVIAARDSETFYKHLVDDWFVPLRRTIRDPGPDKDNWTGSDWARHIIHHQTYTLDPGFAPYPSHAHIDLLPEIQGKGFGRRGMKHLFDTLAAAGSSGVHLGVSPRNRQALAFYEAIGMTRLEDVPRNAIWMAQRLP